MAGKSEIDVAYVAKLARLNLSDAETSLFQKQLGDVLKYAEKLREELTLARMDRHSGQLDELDVEGILAFAERTCGCRHHSNSVSSSNNCSFRTESRSTETALFEPA